METVFAHIVPFQQMLGANMMPRKQRLDWLRGQNFRVDHVGTAEHTCGYNKSYKEVFPHSDLTVCLVGSRWDDDDKLVESEVRT